ncbi:MAG: hypothetical protein R3B36_30045 [Polyangiaceae bacterium]
MSPVDDGALAIADATAGADADVVVAVDGGAERTDAGGAGGV